MSIDTLIFAPWILTVEKDAPLLTDHALAIKNNKIEAILPQAEAKALAKTMKADQVLHLDNHVLMPGLINLHGHSAMTLLRGYADDLALMDWLQNHIWPAEGKYVNAEFVYDGTRLAMAEMIRGGTTCINDMYFYHSEVAKAARSMNMRTYVGCSVLEFPTNYAKNADEYISKAMQARSEYLNDDLVTFTLAPHAPYTVADETFSKLVNLRDQHDMLVHCHIHETEFEISESLKLHQKRPLARLDNLGVLDQHLIAAHMVHTTDEEIKLLAAKKVGVAHNPTSNMKLASGFARVQNMLDAGVSVGLGTDGSASNNKLDMISDIRLAALIAKGFSGNPTDLKALSAIEMATINGAKALGREHELGSLKAGKLADIIAIDLQSYVETLPVFDPISHIAYSADREQVSHVWINGRKVLDNKTLVDFKLSDFVENAKMWQKKIAK